MIAFIGGNQFVYITHLNSFLFPFTLSRLILPVSDAFIYVFKA